MVQNLNYVWKYLMTFYVGKTWLDDFFLNHMIRLLWIMLKAIEYFSSWSKCLCIKELKYFHVVVGNNIVPNLRVSVMWERA